MQNRLAAAINLTISSYSGIEDGFHGLEEHIYPDCITHDTTTTCYTKSAFFLLLQSYVQGLYPCLQHTQSASCCPYLLFIPLIGLSSNANPGTVKLTMWTRVHRVVPPNPGMSPKSDFLLRIRSYTAPPIY